MKHISLNTKGMNYLWKSTLLSVFIVSLVACSTDSVTDVLDSEGNPIVDGTDGDPSQPFNADINGDGELNILILGSSTSIYSNYYGESFAAENIALELNSILSQDTNTTATVYVEAEDIFTSKVVSSARYSRHSLMQYYYWPEGKGARMDKLSGNGDKDWDYVVIAADPYMVSYLPGYYSLGVNKIADKVVEGGAKPLLMMMWPKKETLLASVDHFEEFTYRTSQGARVAVETIPAGLAWQALSDDKKEDTETHPSPNGAYTAAASIYSQLYSKSASESGYVYDAIIAETVLSSVESAAKNTHFSGERTFISPFKSCDIDDSVLRYNHTGTSTENGILRGLQWIIGKSDKELQKDGPSPINFNYGRANIYYEAHKRYKIDPTKFDFSIGFPMQESSEFGNVTQLYGIDKKGSLQDNGTDVAVAIYMVRKDELPSARAIPIRTLFAQLMDMNIITSGYSDNWHMNRDLDKASAGFMYTMLTGACDLGEEPTDKDSGAWKSWAAHKVGYETAWNVMYLDGNAPTCE